MQIITPKTTLSLKHAFVFNFVYDKENPKLDVLLLSDDEYSLVTSLTQIYDNNGQILVNQLNDLILKHRINIAYLFSESSFQDNEYGYLASQLIPEICRKLQVLLFITQKKEFNFEVNKAVKSDALKSIPGFSILSSNNLIQSSLFDNLDFPSVKDFNGKDFLVYTDGSNIGSDKKKSGFSVVVIDRNLQVYYFNKGFRNSTSQRMELSAINYALEYLSPLGSFRLKTDSEYSCKTYNEWVDKWHKVNYKDKKNVDLVKHLRLLKHKYFNSVTIEWTKAHIGTCFNEIADDLANPKRWKNNELSIDYVYEESQKN